MLFSTLDVSAAGALGDTSSMPGDVFSLAGMLWALMTSLFLLWFIGWFWSMASFLDSIAPAHLRLGKSFFHFACIYPVLYVPVFTLFLPHQQASLLFLVFPLHALATFCMFYLLYFVSKSLSIVETSKSVTFYDDAGPFFLLWFFPVGVWVGAT
ncbi:MAG: hypothetical protein ACRD3P_13405 [Terriglobales bacterium]